MLRPIRITLVVLFVLLLLGAGGLYYYNYTHEDVSRPAFTVDEERLEVSVNDPREAFTRGLRAFDNVDGEITDRIMVQSVSQFNEDMTFTVRCIVFDDASNYATCERTAVYSDYTPPHFSLSQPMVFGVGETVTFMDRVSAVDCIDGNITDVTIENMDPGDDAVLEAGKHDYQAFTEEELEAFFIQKTEEKKHEEQGK